MNLNPRFYAIAGALILGVVYFGGSYAVKHGYFGQTTEVKSSVPVKSFSASFQTAALRSSYELPVSRVAPPADCPNLQTLAWNAVSPLNLANGGHKTQRGSFVDKYTNGGCLNIIRQDDYAKMESALAKFIQSGGTDNSDQSNAFFIIMGDALPYVSSALNNLGLAGKYSAISAIGFSDGEDQCMLPSNWRDLMRDHKPILIAAVSRDGDWNICVKFAADNGIKINVDQKTIDLDAFNFKDVSMFTDADEALIGGAAEERTVIRDGIAHEKIMVKPNGVATWTPGDVDVVKRFQGSIVGVASTADYKGQMPALIVGAKDWMASHHDYVVGLLKAADRGAMAIRVNHAMDIMDAANQDVFQDKAAGPGYWKQFYEGSSAMNGAGERVRLGGSKAITLQEARDYFGLRAGTLDTFAAVYKVFKDYDTTYYPTDYTGVKAIPAYRDVVDTTYLSDAVRDIPESATAPVTVASMMPAAPISRVVSTAAVHIEFNTGSAVIKPESYPVLEGIVNQAAISSGLKFQFNGFTDDTGSDAVNVPLSRKRAQAVVAYLVQKAPKTFTSDRFEANGYGYGDKTHQPVCREQTTECRAQNRRVQVVQGD